MAKYLEFECIFCGELDRAIRFKGDIMACEPCGRAVRLEPEEDTMIRIILPRHIYNEQRIKLVERITALSIKKLQNVRRGSSYLEVGIDTFYEGFLENENKLYVVGERLSDNAAYIKQDETWDMPTWVIEDGDDYQGCMPY